MVLPILAATVIVAVLLIAYTWQMLALMVLAYLASIPFGMRQNRRQNREWEARSGKTRELGGAGVGQWCGVVKLVNLSVITF